MHAKFYEANILETQSKLMTDLEGKMNVIVASDFFHLFTWEEQVTIGRNFVSLASTEPDTMLIGKFVGKSETESAATDFGHSQRAFWHNESSFRELWRQVEEQTKTSWDVNVKAVRVGEDPMYTHGYIGWFGDDALGIRYVMTRR